MFLYEKCKLFLLLSRRNYQFSSRIMRLSRVMLRLRYPNTGTRPNRMKGAKTMSTKNTNKLNVPEAKAAMNKFKMEAASEVDVPSTY